MRLTEILKEQSDSMLTVLECKPDNCHEIKYYHMGINEKTCLFNFVYLRNSNGKGRVFNICSRECDKHMSYMKEVADKYSVEVRDD